MERQKAIDEKLAGNCEVQAQLDKDIIAIKNQMM